MVKCCCKECYEGCAIRIQGLLVTVCNLCRGGIHKPKPKPDLREKELR